MKRKDKLFILFMLLTIVIVGIEYLLVSPIFAKVDLVASTLVGIVLIIYHGDEICDFLNIK